MKLTRQDIQNTINDAERFNNCVAGPFSNPQYTPNWVAGLCKNFLEAFDDLQKRLNETTTQRDTLQVALEALQPPKPKFRVGQVVSLKGVRPFQIAGRRFQQVSSKGYWIYKERDSLLWSSEVALRPLTPEEIQ